MPSSVRPLPVVADDDAALVRQAQRGHPGAAKEIWIRHANLVRGLLYRTLGHADIDDLVQDTFLRLFDAIGRIKEPSKLVSFIGGITMHVAREELRRRRRRWRLVDVLTKTKPDAPAPSFDAAEALGRFYALLDRIDPDTRIVFVLHDVENMPTTQIAEVLGVSLATAKRRVKKATAHIDRLAIRDPLLCEYVRRGRQPGPRVQEPPAKANHV